MYLMDTIAAVSTPVGEGGIAVIRISGSDSLRILRSVFRRKNDGGFNSHRFYYGHIVSTEKSVLIDEAMCVYMKAPRSFTCEDVVEIQCHGGTILIQQVLALVLASGARLADPGEFTRRAFLNGRIDLVQAEAVMDLVSGKTEASVAVARTHVDGVLSTTLFSIRDDIRHALALIEAYVDFPDEDMGEADLSLFTGRINSALATSRRLIDSYEEGKAVRDGVSVMIAGKPNVGKSSLLNALLKEKRAIVTPIPGTTRDFIEETINISGLPVRLLDTAGIRTSADIVERAGVTLAIDKIQSADLVLFMIDASRSFDREDRFVLEALSDSKVVVVLNKADLPHIVSLPEELASLPVISLSAATGSGVEALKGLISTLFLHGKVIDSREYLLLTRARHKDTLVALVNILEKFVSSYNVVFHDELAAVDLREALYQLGRITGETTTEDILDIVFSQFCIGK